MQFVAEASMENGNEVYKDGEYEIVNIPLEADDRLGADGGGLRHPCQVLGLRSLTLSWGLGLRPIPKPSNAICVSYKA